MTAKLKKTMVEVLEAIRVYYAKPGNSGGGNLHIVLDDGNLEVHHIEWCRDFAQENHDDDGVELANTLLSISESQLDEIYASYDVYNPW